MTVIFACLLIYVILSFVSSVTDVFVEDVSLLHVSSSLCGGGWTTKEFVKINSWELNSHFYDLERPNFLNLRCVLFSSHTKLPYEPSSRMKTQGSSNNVSGFITIPCSFTFEYSAFLNSECSCGLQFLHFWIIFFLKNIFFFFPHTCSWTVSLLSWNWTFPLSNHVPQSIVLKGNDAK